MPKPKPNEQKKDYIPRCIKYLSNEPKWADKSNDAKYAHCLGLWKKYRGRKGQAENIEINEG